MDMLEGVFFMQNLISVPVPMTSCRQEAYLQRLRRQFPFVYIRPLTRTAFGRRVWALQLGGGSRKVLVAAGHHANECITSDALWQWLFAYCEALLDGGALDGVPARELYHDTMVYLVPLTNPDGADLAAGICAPDSPEYRAAAAIAAQYPEVPFPSGWKANLRGVDLNLNYPARWETARRIKKEQGVCTPAPRDFVGFSPLDQPESAALAAFARCVHPDLMLALHTQGSVIYPRRIGSGRVHRAGGGDVRSVRLPGGTGAGGLGQRGLQGLVSAVLPASGIHHRDGDRRKSPAHDAAARALQGAPRHHDYGAFVVISPVLPSSSR